MAPCQGWSYEWTQRGIHQLKFTKLNERDTKPALGHGFIFICKLRTSFQNETMDHVLLPLVGGGLFGNGHILGNMLTSTVKTTQQVHWSITELVQRTIDKAAADQEHQNRKEDSDSQIT